MIAGSMLAVTLAVVFLTSALSGVLGMGGGMILMAFLAGLLPVTTAMVVHGVVQSVAIGSRSIFLFRHVCWRVLPTFAAGIVAGLALFSFAVFSTETWVVYLLMGALDWLSLYISGSAGFCWICHFDVRTARSVSNSMKWYP